MNLEIRPVPGYRPLSQSALTQEETMEFVMPDYCADVGRIISCHTEPMVSEKRVFDSSFEIIGSVCVTVLYIAENVSGLRSQKFLLPFTMRQEAGESLSHIETRLFVEGCDCRLLNARKLFCHCKIKALVTPYSKNTLAYCSELQADKALGMQCMQKKKKLTYVQSILEKEFHFSDTIAVSAEKPDVEEILLSKITPVILESKACGTKFIVKGSFGVSALCRSEDSQYFTVSGNLPFSQILETEELPEDTTGDVDIVLCETALHSSGAEQKHIELVITAQIFAKAKRSEELTYLSDVYSIVYPTAVETAVLHFTQTDTGIKKQQELRQMLETGIQASSILMTDISCGPVSIAKEGDVHSLRTLVTTQVLYLDESDTPALAQSRGESSVEVELPVGCTCLCEGCIPREIGTNVMANGIESRASIEFPVHAQSCTRDICIQSVEVDEEHPKDLSDQPSVVVRRCRNEDSLWQLARTYNTTVQAIENANPGIDEESFQMVLIPRARV